MLWRRKLTLEPVEQSYGVLSNRVMTMTYDILQRLWLLVLLLVVAPLEREHCRRIAGVTTVPGVVYRAPLFSIFINVHRTDESCFWKKYFVFPRGAHFSYCRVRDGAKVS
jgi:hypothetical protein